jgi:hypothetical protein
VKLLLDRAIILQVSVDDFEAKQKNDTKINTDTLFSV